MRRRSIDWMKANGIMACGSRRRERAARRLLRVLARASFARDVAKSYLESKAERAEMVASLRQKIAQE